MSRPWSHADTLRDTANVRADDATYRAATEQAAAWDAGDDYDRPTARQIAADEDWADRHGY